MPRYVRPAGPGAEHGALLLAAHAGALRPRRSTKPAHLLPNPPQVDVYHTFFGIAGLSLMGRPGLAPIDPTFALPVEVVERVRRRRRGGSGDSGAMPAGQTTD